MTNILWLIFFWFRYWFMCGINSFSSSNLFLYGTSIPSWWGPQSSFLFAFTPDNSKTPEKECDNDKKKTFEWNTWITQRCLKNTLKWLLCFKLIFFTKYNHFYVIKIISSKAQDLKILQSNMWHELYILPTKFNCIFATSVRIYFDHFWKETLILTCFMDNFNCCIQFLFNMFAKLISISKFKYDYCITLFKTMITVLDDLKN